MKDYRKALGRQDITLHGIEPSSHAAHALVKADYHMKLVGMGIEPGVLGVKDVLSLMAESDERPKDSSLIRWWFSLNYDSIQASPDRLAFALQGPAVRVMSENEWLDAMGRRRATGTSDQPTREFAAAFTSHYEQLSEKYPVYADLRNVFDLAMVCGLIREQGLDQKVGWNASFFQFAQDQGDVYATEVWPTPREVDTVMNYKELARRVGRTRTTETFVGVSGGVTADVGAALKKLEVQVDDYQALTAQQRGSEPETWNAQQWWWD